MHGSGPALVVAGNPFDVKFRKSRGTNVPGSSSLTGNSAVLGNALRPVALRPNLSIGLPCFQCLGGTLTPLRSVLPASSEPNLEKCDKSLKALLLTGDTSFAYPYQ